MRLEQDWRPDYPYCVVCAEKTKEETCSDICYNKLTMLRFTINERKEVEKTGLKLYDEHSIKKCRKIQDMLTTKKE